MPTSRLEVTAGEWRPVSPRFIVSELIGAAVTVLLLGAAAGVMLWLDLPWIAAGIGVLVLVGLVGAAFIPRRVRAIGYLLREDDILYRRGILFQRIVAVPYGRMQLVDINRGPLDRALGLSRLKLVTAAASTAVSIDGLAHDDAERLRDHLVDLAEIRRAGL